MSLARLPFFRASAIRSLHTSALRRNDKAPTGLLDATPKAAPHAADAVAGKVPGLYTERLSPGEITAETISGAPSALPTFLFVLIKCANKGYRSEETTGGWRRRIDEERWGTA